MGIDLDKMRSKLNEVKGKGGRNSSFWRPQDGDQTIRIVPTADGDPFKEFWFHYNLGKNAGFLSPYRNFGEADPLNDFVRSLFNEKTEESTKLAKNLMARQRFFSPVIVRGEESKGVRIWGYGKTVYEQLLNLVLNPEYGDITDPDAGTDLTINYGKPAGAAFPVTRLTPYRRTSAICPDLSAEECAELLETVPDIASLFDRKTPENVQTLLDEYLASDELAEAGSSETQKYGGTDTKSDTSNSVDQAFSDLLG
jgi:hypothetical protein